MDGGDFRDYVQKHFQDNGMLAKFTAEMKSHIYNSIDTTTTIGKSSITTTDIIKKSTISPELDNLLSTDEGVLSILLIQDMFDCLNLTYTNSVYKTETGGDFSRYKFLTHNELLAIFQLDSDELNIKTNKLRTPILYQIIMKYKTLNKILLKRLMEQTDEMVKLTEDNCVDDRQMKNNDDIGDEKQEQLCDIETSIKSFIDNCKITKE